MRASAIPPAAEPKKRAAKQGCRAGEPRRRRRSRSACKKRREPPTPADERERVTVDGAASGRRLSNLDKVLYPDDRHHQGRGHRLLRRASRRRCCRTSPGGASRSSGSPTAPTSRASSRSAARSTGPSGSTPPSVPATTTATIGVLPVRRAGRAGVVGQHGRARAARADGAGRRPRDADERWCSTSIPARRRRSSSAARSRCWRATCSPRSACEGWPKTSGSKGLQLYVPLNTPCTHEQAADFALAVGQLLEKQHPSGSPPRWPRRCGRGRSSSTGARTPGTRPRSACTRCGPARSPCVSTPVTWDEVQECADGGARAALRVARRARAGRRLGDLFAPVLTLEQTLPSGG